MQNVLFLTTLHEITLPDLSPEPEKIFREMSIFTGVGATVKFECLPIHPNAGAITYSERRLNDRSQSL